MPYYTGGDYYGRGDYYVGDPGLFGSIARFAGRAIGAVAGATPIGRVVSTGVAIARRLGSRPAAQSVTPGTSLIPSVAPPVLQTIGTVDPGMAAIEARMMLAQGRLAPLTDGKCGFKGFHINRSAYVTYGRREAPTFNYVPPRSRCVRNRTMNPANGKALRRALRRAAAFKRVAMRSINLLAPAGKKKRFGGFKTKGRKRA